MLVHISLKTIRNIRHRHLKTIDKHGEVVRQCDIDKHYGICQRDGICIINLYCIHVHVVIMFYIFYRRTNIAENINKVT